MRSYSTTCMPQLLTYSIADLRGTNVARRTTWSAAIEQVRQREDDPPREKSRSGSTKDGSRRARVRLLPFRAGLESVSFSSARVPRPGDPSSNPRPRSAEQAPQRPAHD